MNSHTSLYAALRVQRLRDHILSVVRDAAATLSTRDVAARTLAPVHTRLHTHAQLRIGQVDNCGLGYRVVAYHGLDRAGNNVYLIACPPAAGMVYPHLRALESAGLVFAEPHSSPAQAVRWRYATPDASQQLLAELETSFAFSAGGNR